MFDLNELPDELYAVVTFTLPDGWQTESYHTSPDWTLTEVLNVGTKVAKASSQYKRATKIVISYQGGKYFVPT